MSVADVPRDSPVLSPGHPGGIEAPISAEAVLSGRDQGAGGGSPAPSTLTTVLVAVEDTDESVNAVRTAHRLFGGAARYFVINVGNRPNPESGWAHAYPVAAPMMWYPPTFVDNPAANSTSREVAEKTADAVADKAGLDNVISVGEIGDPASAIIRAANENQVDVVVIASHERGWFSRLFIGSVEGDLLRSAHFSVLVVK